MFSNNLKQIFRGLRKYKGFTLINLLGLAIGIAALILIFMISGYEKSFDKFHADEKNIYRVVQKNKVDGKENYEACVPYPTAKLLRNEYPGILATELHFSKDVSVRIDNQAPFHEEDVLFADSLFFKVLDFSAIKGLEITGNAAQALTAPGKAILTATTAKRYFGSGNPIGKIIKLDAKLDVQVVAVIKDIPVTTHLPVNMILSYSSLTNDFLGGFDINSWNFTSNGYCYVRLDKANSAAGVESALNTIVKNNSDGAKEKSQKLLLQPLSEIHFNPAFEATNPSYTVSTKYLWMLTLLGMFIILVACVNYINLSTSLAFTKSKEVGIRKTIGASKKQLFFYYMLETLLVTVIAAVIGLLIALLFVPYVNSLLDKAISAEQLMNAGFVLAALTCICLVSFISGIYPALILSGFKPIQSLKNQVSIPGRSSNLLRRSLVVFQFTTSIALIICTIVIARQMQYFHTKSLGFNKDAVVEVALPGPDSARRQALASLLINQPGIRDISFCLGAPISNNGISTSINAPELADNAQYDIKILACDRDYLETYGLKIIAGRWFLNGEEKQLGSGIVINESLVQTLGYKNASVVIGHKIYLGLNRYNPSIIGVVKNFHTTSLHQAIKPAALMPFPYFYYSAGVKIDPAGIKSTLARIESAFKNVYPESVFELNFIDQQLATLYEQETKDYNLFKVFSIISVFICCMGLWGLITFVIVRKTKEIGIRKVLGAGIYNIVGLLSKDFMKLILIALLIASPLAWYFMHQWLQNFAYRIGISWWIFALAGLSAIVIALFTISFQALKAALVNPVKSLRTE